LYFKTNVTNNVCILCSGNHKFSPFNVLAECRAKVPDTLPIPIMVVGEESDHLNFYAIRDPSTKGFKNLSTNDIDRIVSKKTVALSNSAIYWSDGIEILGVSGNGYIKTSNDGLRYIIKAPLDPDEKYIIMKKNTLIKINNTHAYKNIFSILEKDKIFILNNSDDYYVGYGNIFNSNINPEQIKDIFFNKVNLSDEKIKNNYEMFCKFNSTE
jgi:hypothetical protein